MIIIIIVPVVRLLIFAALVIVVAITTVVRQRIRLWPLKPGQRIRLRIGASPLPHGGLPGPVIDPYKNYTVKGGEGAGTITFRETGQARYHVKNFRFPLPPCV
jgi:hypothetical protein